MPTAYIGFLLKPNGFFDAEPGQRRAAVAEEGGEGGVLSLDCHWSGFKFFQTVTAGPPSPSAKWPITRSIRPLPNSVAGGAGDVVAGGRSGSECRTNSARRRCSR